MADDHSTDIGMPPEPMRDSSTSSNSSNIESSASPIEPMGGERRLAHVVFENLVDPEKPTFRLKQSTEATFISHVERHFRTFQNTPGREPWQDTFIAVFQRQVEAAAGNRPFASIPEEERNQLIAGESRRFVAETRNLQAVLGITRFNVETLQKITRARIDNDRALMRTIHEPSRRTISGGATYDRYDRGSNRAATLVGLAARKLIGGKPIGLSDKFNDTLQDAGLPRIETDILQTSSEAAKRASEKRAASNARTTNKSSDIHVEFPATGSRIATLTGLTAAQIELAKSYGLFAGVDYEEADLLDPIEKDLLDITEARVDFYTATKMDIAKVQVDFNPATVPQGPHTSIERLVNRMPGLTLAQEVARTNEQAMQIAQENLLNRLREGLTLEKLAEERRIVDESIEALGRPKTDAEVKDEKAGLEKQKELLAKRKERALAREALEKQRDTAVQASKDVDDTYPSPADAAADYAAYDTWLTDRTALKDSLTAIQVEQAQYKVTLEQITKLEEERSTRLDQIANLTETETVDSKGVKTVKKTAATSIQTINDRLDEIKGNLQGLRESYPIIDPATGLQAVNAAGNPMFVNIENRMSQIAAQLVRDQARLVAMQDNPVGWDAERTARAKGKKDSDALIARINLQITNGLASNSLDSESSEVIQKSIETMQERIANVNKIDDYNRHRQEAYIGVRDYMFSTNARNGFRDRVTLLRAGAANLPMPRAEFYNNWPEAHIRIIQGVFGNEAIERPEIFQRVLRILPPERATELYNQIHGGIITDTAVYHALPPASISSQDIEYIWDMLHDDAVDARNLALVPADEQNVITSLRTVDALPASAKAPEEAVQELERDHFYYRDLGDLQLQILIDWAQKDGVALESYLTPNTPFNIDKIQWAAVHAQAVDRYRKQRLAQAYGNPVAAPAPAAPTP